jgi:hypothetical protein
MSVINVNITAFHALQIFHALFVKITIHWNKDYAKDNAKMDILEMFQIKIT